MTRALLLNSGLAWAAYQAGALHHLVVDRRLRFDLCAGTGLGAVNAALVACDEMKALHTFWRNFSLRRLVGLNWRSPWRDGPLTFKPLRKFVDAHVHEETLKRRGVQLLFNCLDATTGEIQTFHYPGCSVPLSEALVAAASLPGLAAPLRKDSAQWTDATMVESFMLRALLRHPVAELWVVAATLPQPGAATNKDAIARRGKRNWRATVSRGLHLNQAQDVRDGLDYAHEALAAAAAYHGAHADLSQALRQQVDDAELRGRLEQQLQRIVTASSFPWKGTTATTVQLLTPSFPLQFPLWRFRAREIRGAMTLGYTDAQALTPGAGSSA